MGSMSRARSGVPWERGGPRLAPPAGAVASMRRLGCPPLWFDPGNRTVLSVQKPWPDGCVSTEAGGPRPTRGALAPLVALATCLAADVVPGRPSRAVLSSSRPAASTLDCRHRCAGRHRDGWGEQRGWEGPGGCTSRTLPEPSCLASAPPVAATGVALGAFPRRGFIDYDSDAIRLRNPDALPPAHRKPGMCRRSPPACDRWHIRQPVLAARFTAVLPRGSGGDTGGARRNRQGMGTQRKDRCSGGPETFRGWSPGTGGSGLAAGGAGQGAVAHRRDPSASLSRPALSRPERAWPFVVDWRVLLARCGRPVLRTWERPGGSTPSRRTRRAG